MPKYIDADKLLEEAKRLSGPHTGDGWSNWGVFALIERQPAADVEMVRHGHNVKWDYPTLFECSLCGWECFDTVPGDTDTYQYCPNCGAKMGKE